jgi:hypothetical protein
VKPFAGQQQRGSYGRQQGGVIPEGGGGSQQGKGLVGKAASWRLDVALAGQARRILQALDEGLQG